MWLNDLRTWLLRHGIINYLLEKKELKSVFDFQLGYHPEDVITLSTGPRQTELIVPMERCIWDFKKSSSCWKFNGAFVFSK